MILPLEGTNLYFTAAPFTFERGSKQTHGQLVPNPHNPEVHVIAVG
jgi:hypothetical protein